MTIRAVNLTVDWSVLRNLYGICGDELCGQALDEVSWHIVVVLQVFNIWRMRKCKKRILEGSFLAVSRQFFQVNACFASSSEIYQIGKRLHSLKLNILGNFDNLLVNVLASFSESPFTKLKLLDKLSNCFMSISQICHLLLFHMVSGISLLQYIFCTFKTIQTFIFSYMLTFMLFSTF